MKSLLSEGCDGGAVIASYATLAQTAAGCTRCAPAAILAGRSWKRTRKRTVKSSRTRKGTAMSETERIRLTHLTEKGG